jgi:putative NADPH-quinone reductase
MNVSLTGFPVARTPEHERVVRILPGVTGKAQRGTLLQLWPRISVRQVVVVNGHPDPAPDRFCAALCEAYAAGARASGLAVTRLNIAGDACDAALRDARSAHRIVIVYPLWLDRPPVSVTSFFEKAAAIPARPRQSARVIVTMDMPAFMHRALLVREEAPARFAGAIALPGLPHAEPIFIGTVASMTAAQRAHWLSLIRDMGGERRVSAH